MRLRVTSLLIAASLLPITVSLATAGPASAACTSSFGKYLNGSIAGTDGRYVDVMIGIALKDSSNRAIGMDGCLMGGGYARTFRVNSNIPASGATSGGTKSWSLTGIPSNAAHAFIEVYPKDSGTYGQTDEVRYGLSWRRNLPVSLGGINLRMPVNCASGGTTGKIWGKFTVNGQAATPYRVMTWSQATDTNSTVLGWGIGRTAVGAYEIDNLVPGQYYAVWMTPWAGAATTIKYNVYISPCKTTPLSFYYTK